jgi:hypothetical protein
MPESGRTMLSSLAVHQHEINAKKLPKTLQEALEVTRSLSIRYIWIDALCIIQDDEIDQEREIETMAQVYSCATLTIAAGVSSHCDGGFLVTKRSPSRILSMWFGSWPEELTRLLLTVSPAWTGPLFSNPLFKRGWTLQERELSVRVLHFTSTNVIFECREAVNRYEVRTAYDLYPDMPMDYSHLFAIAAEPGDWRHRMLDFEDSRKSPWRGRSMKRIAIADWHVIWWRTVRDYSRRRFTDPSDMLPAIAGLADVIEKRLGWSYRAGLWMENLAFDLLWQVVRDARVTEVVDAYVAPSWSWASAGCSTWYCIDDIGPYGIKAMEILEIKVQPAGANKKGKLFGGFLKVKGRMKTVVGAVISAPERFMATAFSLPRKDNVKGEPLLHILWDRKSEVRMDEKLAILLVVQNEFGHGVGLALRRTDVKGVYKRVGLATNISEAFIKDEEPAEVTII